MHTHLTNRLIICIAFLLILTACSVGTSAALTPAPTLATNSPPGIGITPTVTPTEDLSGLSQPEVQTLRSLEQVDIYPLYVMHYVGDYDVVQGNTGELEGMGFGCSLFAALAQPGDMFYGRNFDWNFSPALFLYMDPPDGYASVSMVNLEFIGVGMIEALALSKKPLVERRILLTAPAAPIDGMNEYGLTIGMAAIPDEFLDDASYDASRKTIGSLAIMRQVLDHARNVDEAVEIFSQYNIEFGGGIPIHYLLADPSGKATLIEFYQGEMVQLPNTSAWHMATNHLRCIAQGDGGCSRYRTLSERLPSLGGVLDPQLGMQLLAEVKQDSTQFSTLYNMTQGDIQVALRGLYEAAYSFHLDIITP